MDSITQTIPPTRSLRLSEPPSFTGGGFYKVQLTPDYFILCQGGI